MSVTDEYLANNRAYAEGFELMEASELITDVPGVIQAWSRGTVVRSWLLDLLVDALKEDPRLDQLEGWVDDSGEGRWTIEEAIAHAVPLPVISAALFARFSSRQAESPAMKAVAALRQVDLSEKRDATAPAEAEKDPHPTPRVVE